MHDGDANVAQYGYGYNSGRSGGGDRDMVSGKVCSGKNNQVRKICLKKKILSRGTSFVLCLLLCLSFVALNYKNVEAQSVGNPVNASWSSISASMGECYKWAVDGFACGSNTNRLTSLTLRANGFVANGLYLFSFSFTVKASNTEAFMGFSSGDNFLLIDQTLTQSGDQFHGSVLGLTYASNGVAAFQSSTKYNVNNAWSILFSRPNAAPMFSDDAVDLSGIQQYLQTISWNSTETQKKLEAIITNLNLIKSDISTMAWNSEQTQLKLEALLKAIEGLNVGSGNVEDAIENQTQAEQDRWEAENNKAEEAINSQQDTGADGSDEAAKENLNLFKVILETPAGSCKLPEIEAFGFSLGAMDLCTYRPPNWLQQVMGAVVTITLAGASIRCTVRVLETLGRAYGGTR